jgi:hypothetical protein
LAGVLAALGVGNHCRSSNKRYLHHPVGQRFLYHFSFFASFFVFFVIKNDKIYQP